MYSKRDLKTQCRRLVSTLCQRWHVEFDVYLLCYVIIIRYVQRAVANKGILIKQLDKTKGAIVKLIPHTASCLHNS